MQKEESPLNRCSAGFLWLSDLEYDHSFERTGCGGSEERVEISHHGFGRRGCVVADFFCDSVFKGVEVGVGGGGIGAGFAFFS